MGCWISDSVFGVRCSELGTWNLEFGIWNLEFGIWNLEFRYCHPERAGGDGRIYVANGTVCELTTRILHGAAIVQDDIFEIFDLRSEISYLRLRRVPS